MGKKKYFDFGAKKTVKAVEAVKGYIGGLTKRQKERIVKELEQEVDDAEDEIPKPEIVASSDIISFSPSYFAQTNWNFEPTQSITYYLDNDGHFIPVPLTEAVEDVQDVDFEE